MLSVSVKTNIIPTPLLLNFLIVSVFGRRFKQPKRILNLMRAFFEPNNYSIRILKQNIHTFLTSK